jgi:hypothetical protein
MINLLRKAKKVFNDLIYFSLYGYKMLFPGKTDKTVVVLGMHRSGTSLTSGILQILGVSMGNVSKTTDGFNKKGHFESTKIRVLNERILNDIGCSWHSPPNNGVDQEIRDKYAKKIKQTLDMERSYLWGWKDPRTIFLLDLYLPHIVNPHFVVCRRSVEEVGLSLNKRNGFPVSKGRDLAITYNKKIDEFIKDCSFPMVEIDFADYFSDFDKTLEKISGFLEIKINLEIKEKIEDFVDRNLITSGV